MRRWLKAVMTGIATGLAGTILALTPLGAGLEQGVGLRWLFQFRGPIDPPPEVVVVGIDDQSGTNLGLSALPREWPRSVHARLIERLVAAGASAIVFDFDFERPKLIENDLAFAKAIADADRVVLTEKLSGKRQPILDRSGKPKGFVWVEQLIPPMPLLVEAAKGLGPFPMPKMEAAVHGFWSFKPSLGDAPTTPALALQVHALPIYPRWLEMLAQAGNPNSDSLRGKGDDAWRTAQVQELMRRHREGFKQNPELGARLRHALETATDLEPGARQLMQALLSLYEGTDHRYLNFYGPPGTIATLPYHALFESGGPNRETLDLTGKTIFVGYSDLYDPGQPDRHYTVFTADDGVDLSGVEIAATAFANLLTDRGLRPSTPAMTAAILAAFGLGMGFIVYLLPAMAGVPIALTLAVLYAAAVQAGFNQSTWWLPLSIPLLVQLPLALFVGLLGQYLLERRQKKHATRAISYYLPEKMARDLAENLDPSAVNRVVYGTCFASDMAGFSTIAETMPPKELALFLNDYFETISEPLKRHKVDVTEFRADGIMCAWTAEHPEVSVRRKAILAALDAVDAVARFKERRALARSPVRIGLEAGTVYVGHAGGGGHFVYSIVGDCANTAARVEGLNKHLGTHLLATQSVVAGVPDLLLRPVGDFVFVGKSEAIPIFEIMNAANGTHALLCERFAAVIEVLEEGDWVKAAESLEAILRDYPDDGPTRFHLARCRRFQDGTLPADSPHVVNMDTK